ncbi:MAG: MBL fold metallo-hydrolase [Anaerolineae bacterium]|jgi:glyoxylase-like metal-dependent hydrolase (beta-lactamase superfamily II)|nr:MBL fold metallo-hydrolase [Anaerolineae bacterium]
MSIEVQVLALGVAYTNCYIIGDTESKQAIVIDPVDKAQLIYQTAVQAGWTIKLILATHGHFDHVLASKELKRLTDAPFCINERELPLLENIPEQGVRYIGTRFPEPAKPDRFLTDEPEIIEVGAIKLETIFTPGHTPGHISFYFREFDLLFSGDVLFDGTIGRTDLPESDRDTLIKSIFEKLFPLGDDVRVLAGHGRETTLGIERETNIFLR